MNKGNEMNERDRAGKIDRFEDLIAWQQARILTGEIYSAIGMGPLKNDFGLRDQLRRASVSVMSNIAEGFERLGAREKVQFMNIARASCAEVKSLLYVCLDNQYLEADSVTELQTRWSRISRLTSGLIRSVTRKRSESESGVGSETKAESESGPKSDSDSNPDSDSEH